MSDNWNHDGPYLQEQSRFNWRRSLGEVVQPTVKRDRDFLHIDYCLTCNRKIYRLGSRRLESTNWPWRLHKCNRPEDPEYLLKLDLWEPKKQEIRLGRVALHLVDLWDNILVLQATPFDGHCVELAGDAPKISSGDLVIFRLGAYGRIAFLGDRNGGRIGLKQARVEPANLGLQSNWGARSLQDYRFGDLPPHHHQCQFCNQVLHVNILAEHILNTHELMEKESHDAPTEQQVSCWYCNELIEKKLLPGHLRRKHPKRRRKGAR